MNRPLRFVVMTLLACAPWVTHAQSVKCPRPAASDVHRQSQCGQSKVSHDVSTGSSDGLFHFSRVRNELTPACRDSADDVTGRCVSQVDAATKHCWQTRLSTACQDQTSLLRAKRAPACEQQITSCEGESLTEFPACVQRELPSACMEQIRAANRARERRN
jgi:hypothetical protein